MPSISPEAVTSLRRSTRAKKRIVLAENDEENEGPQSAPKKSRASKPKSEDAIVIADGTGSPTEGASSSLKAKKSGGAAVSKPKKAPARKEKEMAPHEDNEEHEDEEDGEVLKKGDRLPSIKLKDEEGNTVDVSTLAGEKGVVFFLYPKADTPGCTNQACGYRDMFDEIAVFGYEVYGLSKDTPTAQQKWKAKKSLNYHLLSDPKSKLIKRLGAFVPPKNTKRSHFIFEKGTGNLIDIDIGVRPAEDPNNVLGFLTEKYL
ncbi:peroxiredoxin Q/BCP [Cryptococcus neoformans var. grubii Br795]|uniref:thioredoxin-dependent peroxiredoxin n=1 Tax=Cryptococcus neoformans Tu259-1 TaxID=1230072 RepID=A0A854QHH9_CRYNE|nr:peroxiredoxin Q/BCP [Cryptococcus neoformans var. grubii 125.91]OXG25871.1 peroxiredoxin Q/BCP [Cryptococcus neoformans var. grubii Tu259-1]OXG38008.1 peroxiredoxin Q/BCP [Cryptococcus neoformans var. grubii Bt15]OXG52546.1 peroxiredoxin Q/BCP [Cryptococcus neoformans var. grubii Th84]OXG85103.1 peroxiredoxin Q/BCP [Cryptococcus neoformans var. grubii MW-RSA36]OXG86688.1 peroxiredoxin Q/BCP [Cryptococcus neoformans var. grubii Br795]OXG90572.1 peroxiredoxin Q/BCP [Cryptococcus neoformans v